MHHGADSCAEVVTTAVTDQVESLLYRARVRHQSDPGLTGVYGQVEHEAGEERLDGLESGMIDSRR